MYLHPGRWVKVKIKGLICRGIIADIYETRVDIMIQSPEDNVLRRFSVQTEDIVDD